MYGRFGYSGLNSVSAVSGGAIKSEVASGVVGPWRDSEDVFGDHQREWTDLMAARRRRTASCESTWARRVGVGGSCGSSVENRWSAQLDLGDGEPLDNLHGAAAVRTLPEG